MREEKGKEVRGGEMREVEGAASILITRSLRSRTGSPLLPSPLVSLDTSLLCSHCRLTVQISPPPPPQLKYRYTDKKEAD